MKKIIIILTVLMLLTTLKTYSQQQVKAIGLTDSSTVTTTWNGNKMGRFMKTGITNIYMLRTTDSHRDYGTEIGTTGFYEFDSVGIYPGFYKLYVNGVERREYGTVQVATFLVKGVDDTAFVHTTGATEYSWVTNMYHQGQVQFYNYCPASMVLPTISSHLANKQYVDTKDTGIVHTTGSENLYGIYVNYGSVAFVGTQPPACNTNPTTNNSLTRRGYVDSLVQNINDTNYVHTTGTDYIYGTLISAPGSATIFNGSNPPIVYAAPTSGDHVTNKTYVDYEVSQIVHSPYQESSNRVRLIPNGTTITGVVYTSFKSAVNYFVNESATNPCYIEIFPYNTNVTIEHNDLNNYVHLYSSFYNRERRSGNDTLSSPLIILGCGTASTTKSDVRFEGLSILMGAKDITTDRTYNGFTFKDCTIYAFKNLTFTNCTLSNITIYQSSGYNVTYNGSTEIYDCRFNQHTTQGGSFTGFISTMIDGFKTNYLMPTDISVACTW